MPKTSKKPKKVRTSRIGANDSWQVPAGVNLYQVLGLQGLIPSEPARTAKAVPITDILARMDKKTREALQGSSFRITNNEDAQRALSALSVGVHRYKETGILEDLFSEIEKVTGPLKPAGRWLLISVLWPVLLGVLGNLATDPVQRFLKQHKPDKAQIAQAVSAGAVLPDLRFAKTEGVRIRRKPDTTSEIISKLHRGQVVNVTQSRGGWLLIVLKSGDSEVIGWTYANTLGKLSGE